MRSPGEAAATESLARRIWDFHRLGHVLDRSDAIVVLGSNDVRVAEHGARLWLEGLAPLLVFSGGRGLLTKDWKEPEAVVFAERAVAMGVPEEGILLETRSANTGENVRFTRDLFRERGLDPERWILVHKPYMERRSLATFQKYVPGRVARVTSPPVPFEEFATLELPRERLIHRIVGDLHRILEYPKLGFQAPQDVPQDVLEAFRELVRRGYRDCLVPPGD